MPFAGFLLSKVPNQVIIVLIYFSTESCGIAVKQLVFERSAIKHNTAAIQERAGSAAIFAVLVGDAYGAGLIELAQLLREEGIGRFAVDEAEDVLRLRQAGFTEEPILMLRSTTDQEELTTLLEQKAICTIGSYEAGVALNAAAEEMGVTAEAHVLIDTGMGFGGFLSSEPQKLLSIYHYLPNVSITGTYTHLCACAEDTTRQMAVFQGVLDTIQAAHLDAGLIHAAGSSALMNGTDTRLGAVRIGSAFLGTCRTQRRDSKLLPVYHGEAVLDTVRWLPKGHTVGNEVMTTLRRPTRVGILPIGYQHGFGVQRARRSGFWAFLKAWRDRRHRFVTINGQKAKVIGRVGALETAVDVTDLHCSEGDLAIFQIDAVFARGIPRIYQ